MSEPIISPVGETPPTFSTDTRTAVREAYVYLLRQGKTGGAPEILKLIGRGSNSTISDELPLIRKEVGDLYESTREMNDLPGEVAKASAAMVREVIKMAIGIANEHLANQREAMSLAIEQASETERKATSEVSHLRSELEMARSTIATLELALRENRELLERVENDRDTFRTELDKERQAHEDSRRRASVELKVSLERVQGELSAKIELLEMVRYDMGQLSARNESLSREVELVNTALRKAQSDLTLSQQTITTQETQLTELRINAKAIPLLEAKQLENEIEIRQLRDELVRVNTLLLQEQNASSRLQAELDGERILKNRLSERVAILETLNDKIDSKDDGHAKEPSPQEKT